MWFIYIYIYIYTRISGSGSFVVYIHIYTTYISILYVNDDLFVHIYIYIHTVYMYIYIYLYVYTYLYTYIIIYPLCLHTHRSLVWFSASNVWSSHIWRVPVSASGEVQRVKPLGQKRWYLKSWMDYFHEKPSMGTAGSFFQETSICCCSVPPRSCFAVLCSPYSHAFTIGSTTLRPRTSCLPKPRLVAA